MKKYVTGLVAVILAISFSAFTPTGKSNHTTLTKYYWYPVDNVANEIAGTAINPNSLKDKDEAMAGASVTSCQDNQGQPLCVVGSSDPNLEQHDAIPADAGDNFILRTAQ